MNIKFNQKNEIDVPQNNRVSVGFNKASQPFNHGYTRGNAPLDLAQFQQKIEELQALHPEQPPDYKKEYLLRENQILPDLMPYRNNTPPYMRQRYKQDMKMKSLDTILKYRKDNERNSIFSQKAYGQPVRYYQEYYKPESTKGTILSSFNNNNDEPLPKNAPPNFINNKPNFYEGKNSNMSQIRNLQLENLHLYKVMASENEQNVNYKIYNNQFPDTVSNIQKQYANQRALISETDEHNFFKRDKDTFHHRYTPLAPRQYDSPNRNLKSSSQPEFKLMTPILPILVPIDEGLPVGYKIPVPYTQPPEEQQITDIKNELKKRGHTHLLESIIGKPSNQLQDGRFTEIQKNNRFVDPTAERYSHQKRMESLNAKYKPDLLQPEGKSGYTINPTSTAVQVNYKRAETLKRQKEAEEAAKLVKKQKQKEYQENFYNTDHRFG